jgi:predicted acyl esterase
MRDGVRMATDVYRPKDTSKKVPVVFVRTPYNFNFWDVRLGAPRDMTAELEAVKRGYAYVEMNERGHFFSEAVAHNSVHHSRQDPSQVRITVVKRSTSAD